MRTSVSFTASPSKLKPVAQLFTSIPSFFHQTSSAISSKSEVVTIILKKMLFFFLHVYFSLRIQKCITER